MKKIFYLGFVIGIVYVLVLAVIMATVPPGDDGLGLLFDMLLIPSGFVVGGVLEYFFNQGGLGTFFHYPFVYWGLTAIIQGICFGLVLVIIKKIFSRVQ